MESVTDRKQCFRWAQGRPLVVFGCLSDGRLVVAMVAGFAVAEELYLTTT